jgi:hypothetical protein
MTTDNCADLDLTKTIGFPRFPDYRQGPVVLQHIGMSFPSATDQARLSLMTIIRLRIGNLAIKRISSKTLQHCSLELMRTSMIVMSARLDALRPF